MPEWYKKRILQRPRQETQSITERPSEAYQLELPEFRIPTVTDSEDSVMTGLANRKARDANRKARDAYNQAYNEYLEQHPISPLSGVGYNPYIGIQYNPQVKQQQAAHDYAVKESGYIGDKSTSPYKNVDDAFGAVSAIGVSMIPLLGASYGAFGVLPKLAADTYFGYEGAKDLISPEGVAKTVNFAKQGRGGRAILSGIGDLFNLTLARQGLKGIKTLGAFAKETPYVAKFNWMNRKGPFRMEYPWQRTPETLPERLTLEHIAEEQTPKYNSSQITGHFGKVKYYGPTMGKTTAAAVNSKLVDFDDIIRQPSRNILDRYGFKSKSEMYNSGNQEAIKAYEDMLVKSLQDWRANPENANLTLVASPTAIANPANTGFYFDNIPSIPSRDVFIARNVGRGGTPEASALWYDSLIKQNPNLKIDDRFVSQIESKPYQSPSTKILDPQSDGDALRPFVLGRKPMYSVITKGYGHDAKVIEEADFAIGPNVIKLDYTRPMTGLHGETYQQGMRFYVNPNKLKEVIGQFQDLYKVRLRLPEHWNTNQIYNYIIQHPEKVDVALGETPQDIVGLNLGFGIKDAMLFADGKLKDFGGVYKRTVPNWYAMLKKRLDSGNLKRDHGTFNGDHVTWKFNWGMMDDWARKQAPKMPLPEIKTPYNGEHALTARESFDRFNATGKQRALFMKSHPVDLRMSKDWKPSWNEELAAARRDFANKYAYQFDDSWNKLIERNANIPEFGYSTGTIIGPRPEYYGSVQLNAKSSTNTPLARVVQAHEAGHATGNANDVYIYKYLTKNNILDPNKLFPDRRDYYLGATGADYGELSAHLKELPDWLGLKVNDAGSYIDPSGQVHKINEQDIQNYVNFLRSYGWEKGDTIWDAINPDKMKDFLDFLNQHKFSTIPLITGASLMLKEKE